MYEVEHSLDKLDCCGDSEQNCSIDYFVDWCTFYEFNPRWRECFILFVDGLPALSRFTFMLGWRFKRFFTHYKKIKGDAEGYPSDKKLVNELFEKAIELNKKRRKE